MNIEIFIQGNDNCTAFQFHKAPENPGACTMYNYTELPYHPDHPDHPRVVSSCDSDSYTCSLICGLCAKGPEAREAWETNGSYCFTTGIITN